MSEPSGPDEPATGGTNDNTDTTDTDTDNTINHDNTSYDNTSYDNTSYDTDYNEAGVPSFDYVRDRIEGRHATAAGAAELPADAARAATLDEQLAERDRAGREKLEAIRRSMRGESG